MEISTALRDKVLDAAFASELDQRTKERDAALELAASRLADLEHMTGYATESREEHTRLRKSVGFLRLTLRDLADEVGLAEEDITGITRAVKARNGAGSRVRELEAVRAGQAKILERIGELVGARPGETVEAAVERVVRERDHAREVELETVLGKRP